VPEAHQALLAVQQPLDVLDRVAALSTSSSMVSTRLGAPPCSGPDSAPMAPEMQAAASAPVEAMTRA
jgi:hypothetical protein